MTPSVARRTPIIQQASPSVGLSVVTGEHPFELTEETIVESPIDLSERHADPGWAETEATMMRASCAYFAQEILTGPGYSPYNGRFLISDHHREWDRLVTKNKRLCVLAPRDHGKCGSPDDLISTPSGKRVRLADWEGGELLAYNPQTHRLVTTFAPASRPNGVKRTLMVTTRTGRTITVTENHPFRKLDGWLSADQLHVGDRIAVPYRIRGNGTKQIPDAWLIGLLVGDGGMTGSNVMLSTADDQVLAELDAQGIVYQHASHHDYRLSGMQDRMRELGVWGKTAHDKRIPEIIFEGTDETIAAYLSGYLDADAHVSQHGGGAVEFYSVSEALLRDTQHLLTRLGILSVLSPKRGKYLGKSHDSWRLTIRGKDILRLAACVHPRGARKEVLAALARTQEAKGVCSGDAVDRFPKEVWQWVTHSEDWFRQRGLPRPNVAYEPTREKLATIARAEGNQRLLALTQAEILWDEVIDIAEMGERETWSLCVPEMANYVANDIVNHNTFFFDFAYPIWQAAHAAPGTSGFIFSATKEQAVRILDDIKNEIETNPKLDYLVPKRKSRWGGTSIRLANGHTIYARGFGTKVRGAHPIWIVVDDGLNDETMYSETVRNKQIDYFYSAITNMCVPGGQIIVVGTPFHQSDLYADLKANSEYEFQRYQAWQDADETVPLWPERYSRDQLDAKKRELNSSIRFTREFMCEPISDDMSLFPGWLFVGDPIEQYTVKLGMPKEFWYQRNVKQIFMGVDFALSSSAQADFTVIWTMGIDDHGNRWIIDIQRGKGLAYQAQLSKINEVARRYEPGLIYCEANQAQRIFGDELIRTTDLPIKQFTTGAQKNTLDKGVPSLRTLLENRKIRIPRGDDRSVELTNLWKDEMRNFTWSDGKLQGVGSHDDTVLAFWLCDQAARQGGFSYDFGTDVDTSGNFDEFLDDQTRELEEDETDGVYVNLIDDEHFQLPRNAVVGEWI